MENLLKHVIPVRDLAALMSAMGWTRSPLLDAPETYAYRFVEDINDRRLRDAEVIASACRNSGAKVILEIGTGAGITTALMSRNAPQARVFTVNIPPEEINEGGTYVTGALSREEVGRYYREQGCKNVTQIFANTANWTPDFGPIDLAFVDGCHDADFVYHDTRKVLAQCRPGSLILWHDFCPPLIHVHEWLSAVCGGVERLYLDGLLGARILHVRDAWVGLYTVR